MVVSLSNKLMLLNGSCIRKVCKQLHLYPDFPSIVLIRKYFVTLLLRWFAVITKSHGSLVYSVFPLQSQQRLSSLLKATEHAVGKVAVYFTKPGINTVLNRMDQTLSVVCVVHCNAN